MAAWCRCSISSTTPTNLATSLSATKGRRQRGVQSYHRGHLPTPGLIRRMDTGASLDGGHETHSGEEVGTENFRIAESARSILDSADSPGTKNAGRCPQIQSPISLWPVPDFECGYPACTLLTERMLPSARLRGVPRGEERGCERMGELVFWRLLWVERVRRFRQHFRWKSQECLLLITPKAQDLLPQSTNWT